MLLIKLFINTMLILEFLAPVPHSSFSLMYPASEKSEHGKGLNVGFLSLSTIDIPGWTVLCCGRCSVMDIQKHHYHLIVILQLQYKNVT
jgi:hypothetical protein